MGGIQPQPPQQPPYDVSADYVDSTTAYEPKQPGFLDADFISHGKFKYEMIKTYRLDDDRLDDVIRYDDDLIIDKHILENFTSNGSAEFDPYDSNMRINDRYLIHIQCLKDFFICKP